MATVCFGNTCWPWFGLFPLIYGTDCETDLHRGKDHRRRACHSYQGTHGVWKPWRPRKVFSVQNRGLCPEGQGRVCLDIRKVSVYATAGSVCISVLSVTLGNLVRLPCLVHLCNFKIPFLDRLDFCFLALVSLSSTVLRDPGMTSLPPPHLP